MKKIYSYILITFLFQNLTFSQFDFKSGIDFSLPFGFSISTEYLHQENLGFELGVVTNMGFFIDEVSFSGTSMLLNARYYFNPRYGNDRISVGAYLRPFLMFTKQDFSSFAGGSTFSEQTRYSGMGFGFLVGRKILNKDSSFFESNLGIGRNFLKTVEVSNVPSFNIGEFSIDFFISIKFGFRIE